MINKARDRKKRARLSLQNRDLLRNQLNLKADKEQKEEEEREVTEEEYPLKFFSQQQRKKKKEEEKKKYLFSIAEEDDPLQFVGKDEGAQDPLNFLEIKEEEEEEEGERKPKVLGNLALHDEEKLTKAIKDLELTEEVDQYRSDEEVESPLELKKKMQKMVKRMNTALRVRQRIAIENRTKEKLLERMHKKKSGIAIDQKKEENSNKIDPANNPK